MAFNQEWENIAVVGKGGSSTVYKAIVKPTGQFVAVKQIEIDGLSKDQINGIKGEIETMKDLSHPNILCYLGTQQSPSRVFIFLEYADRGSLRQLYANRGPLSESQISYCLQGIVAGLNYLHENGIAHRDIKCANCLLGSEGVVKLADFGASKRFESDSIVSGLKGTPHWMAPEVIKGTQMTTGWMKADVWSLGCTVVEMFTAKVPYAEYENPMTAMYKIASGEIPSLRPSTLQPLCASAELVSFIHTCCAVEPATRPSVGELLVHALVTREVESVGDLFDELARPAIIADAAAASSRDIEIDNKEHSPMLTQYEKESNKIARRSLNGEIQLHALESTHNHTQRARSDSQGSVLSGADDDETTIANGAEASYLEDDFCSYGGFEDLRRSRSRGESLSVGIGMSRDALEEDADGAPGAQGGGKEPRIQAKLTPLSVPRAASTSRSGSRSRGQSRGMVINTSAAGIGAAQDASVGSNLDDVATPSVFRDSGHGASMVVHLMPMLGEQIGGMSLAESYSTAPLSRKWSATAFPEQLLESVERADNTTANKRSEHSPIEEDIAMTVLIFAEDEVMSETVAEVLPVVSSSPQVPPCVPLVPSFEDASEVYKTMLLKYSPRASKETVRVEVTRTAESVVQAEEEEVAGAAESNYMVVSPITKESSLPPQEKQVSTSIGKLSSPTVLSSKVSSRQSNTARAESSSPSVVQRPSALGSSPKAKKTATTPLGSAPSIERAVVVENVSVGARDLVLNDVQSSKRSHRSKPKTTELGPLNVDRVSAMEPLRKQVMPAQPRSAAPVADHLPIKSRMEDSSRPYAPLSGEKLRLHSFADPKKASLAGDNAPGSSAEALERIVSQSNSAAVRKGAAQELREVRTHRAKGSLSHHVIKANKRPRNQSSPRHVRGLPQQAHYNNQLGSAQGQDRVTAGLGLGGGASLMNSGGVRSQSAGVAPSYSAAQRKEAQKLPPVLRGMNRNAVCSSSGSIEPIEEGRIARGVLSGEGPLRLEGPTSRYIQSAPAVSRSLNLPPIASAQGGRSSHRHGASMDSSAALTIEDADEGTLLSSQTPKTKQPRLHNFGRPVHPSGVSAVLQQSFANVMKNYSTDEQQIES